MASNGRQDIADVLALGPLQRGLYSLNRLTHQDNPAPAAGTGGSDGYAVAVLTDFHGPLDTARLHRALVGLLRRHPHLMATFWDHDLPHPVQLVPADIELSWREVELTAEEFTAHTRAEQDAPFDLTAGPALRVTLGRLGPAHHRLLCVFHHIVIDGWSVPVFWRELAERYAADSPAQTAPSAAYPEYIGWLQGKNTQASLDQWRQALDGLDEPTVVGTGAVPGAQTPTAELTMRYLEGPPLADLLAQVRSHNLTLNTVSQVAWAVLLNRLTGRQDVTFGVTVSGRPEHITDIESTIGLFINTIPARVRLTPDEPLLDLCQRVQREAARLRSHGYVGLSEIQRAAGTGDLFDTLMIFHNTPKGSARDTIDLGGEVTMSPVLMDSFTHYPLTIVPFLLDERLYVNVDHIDSLLGGLCPGRLAERFLQLVQEIARDPSRGHGEMDILLPGEAAELYAPDIAGVAAASEPPERQDYGVHREFEQAASRHPERVAVVDRHGELTYEALDRWSTALARQLRERGVAPETKVAVALPRRQSYFATLLAVLKAGGTLVPLDLSAPESRNTTIAALSGAQVLVAEAGEQTWWDGRRCAPGEGPEDFAATGSTPLPDLTAADQAVHVVFTSGSTGEPKGVVATHRGLLTLLHAHRDQIYRPVTDDLREPLRVGHSWSFAFDASWQPQLALLTGHTLVLFDEEDQHDPARLVRGIHAHRVDMLDTSPSMLGRLTEAGLIKGDRCPLRILALGGEEISRATWDTLAALKGTRVHNFYGPTEITVEAVNALVRAGEEPQIGQAAPGSYALVLGPDLRPVPLGTRGELYLGGPQVARGYQARPALTAERFVPDPVTGARLYRTGDVVRRNAAGRLVFLGRADQQVKIRGYRVELAEIVAALESREDVAKAVVVPFDSGQGRLLAAYVVATAAVREAGGRLDPVALRDDLAQDVPHYMIPARFMELDALPLTVNGKADLRALPRPTGVSSPGSTGRSPAGAAEHAVLTAARELLDAPGLGVEDDLFHHGMDSITTISLTSALRRAGLGCTPRDVLIHRTVEQLARAVQTNSDSRQEQPGSAAQPAVVVGTGEVRTPVLDWMRGLGRYRRFALSQLLTLPGDLTDSDLEALLAAVRRAHPQLDSRTTVAADGRLTLVPVDPPPVERMVRHEEHPKVTPQIHLAAAEQTWERLDPDAGVMFAGTVLRETASAEAWLFLALHHAVADVVSWHTLLDDLAAAHRALATGTTSADTVPVLAEGTSMAAWSDALARRAAGPEPAAQLPYWQGVAKAVARCSGLGGRPPTPGTDTRGDLRSHRVAAPTEVTAALLRSSHATTEAALLAATALAEASWQARREATATSAAGLALVREGHGRQDELLAPYLDEPVDTSRTVGWFNVLHPLVLDAPETRGAPVHETSRPGGSAFTHDTDTEVGRLTVEKAQADGAAALRFLTRVQETLDSVPHGGFDHGLLPDSTEGQPEGQPELLFSYLGRQGEARPDQERRNAPWTPVLDEALQAVFPEDSEPELDQAYVLELITAVHSSPQGPRLESLWRYNPRLTDPVDVRELADSWTRALTALASAVRAADTLPSDSQTPTPNGEVH